MKEMNLLLEMLNPKYSGEEILNAAMTDMQYHIC